MTMEYSWHVGWVLRFEATIGGVHLFSIRSTRHVFIVDSAHVQHKHHGRKDDNHSRYPNGHLDHFRAHSATATLDTVALHSKVSHLVLEGGKMGRKQSRPAVARCTPVRHVANNCCEGSCRFFFLLNLRLRLHYLSHRGPSR